MWFLVILLLAFLFIGIYAGFCIRHDRELLETVTTTYRGTRSERNMVLKLLKHGIAAKAIFHDLYVKKANGQYSQIDLVVATNVGILVFEIKDYSGWLFGKGNQKQWTQILAYGKEKHRFYNPVMQNNGHITALRKQLKQFEQVPFYSIIVFYGNCELKDVSFIPEGTFLAYSTNVINVVNRIINNNQPAYFTDKWEVVKVLKEDVENGNNRDIRVQHIQNVQNMLERERIYE
jgi:hypothetical protein